MSKAIKVSIAIIIGLVLSYVAIVTSRSSTHQECTRWVRSSSEDRECVGEWVIVEGSDWLMVLIFAFFAFWAFAAAWEFFRNH